MPLGPGKFDDLCTYVREKSGGKGAIVIVVGHTPETSGFSCQADLRTTLTLAPMLRTVADQIEEPFRTSYGSPPVQGSGVAPAPVSVLAVLEEVAEFLEGQADVVDGSYGVPHPNKAMSLMQRVEYEIEALKRDR